MQVASELLSLPPEPVELKTATRSLLEHDPARGIREIEEGNWVASRLWACWGPALMARGFAEDDLLDVTRAYGNELRLWVMGERPWEHCVSGLAGRVQRRLPAVADEREVDIAS